jgi:hypothetical protein
MEECVIVDESISWCLFLFIYDFLTDCRVSNGRMINEWSVVKDERSQFCQKILS